MDLAQLNKDSKNADAGAARASGGPVRPTVFLMINTLETGGTERQFVNMVRALDPAKFSVIAGCLGAVGPFVAELPSLQEFSPGGSLFGIQSWRTRWALARFLRNKRVAVAHSFDFYTNLMLIPAARLAGVAAVVGSHRQLGDLLTSRQFQAQKMAFRWCDRIVCNSQAAAERLGKPAWADRVSIIGNGIAPENFVAANPALPREPGSVRVGMVARMNDRGKQHEMFLRAAARLAPQIPSLSFVLAGDGPLRPPMEQLARALGLAQRVLFLGERRDIPAVLAALDVSVLTSNSESLSNVILESMAAGVPVVAADVGGNPELVQNGRTGLLFPAKSEEGLAEALRTLLSQPELRRRMGVESLARVRAEFTVTAIRDRYQSLYHQILTEKSWFRASGKEPQYAVGNCN